jgi:hypothetical protein
MLNIDGPVKTGRHPSRPIRVAVLCLDRDRDRPRRRWGATALAVVVAYEIATIGTMVLLVIPARAAVARATGAWADRWGDALAGGVVATVGLAVIMLGI